MALTTYTALQSAIPNWLGRPADTIILAVVADLIALAEERIFTGCGAPYQTPPLRVREMEQTTDLTVSARAVDLPTRFLETGRLYLNTDPIGEVQFIARNDYWRRYMSTQTGQPLAFTVEGDSFMFGPAPDATYTGKLLYWQRPAALADSSTNDVLTAYPSIYLHAGVLEAMLFLEFEDQVSVTRRQAMLTAAINGANAASDRLRFSSGPLVMRPSGSTP